MILKRKKLRETYSWKMSAGATLIIAALAGLLTACSEPQRGGEGAEELTGLEADNVVYEMTQILTNEGVREARVEADTAFFFRDSSAVHLRSMTLTMFDDTGNTRATVTADRGRLDMSSTTMLGRGNVVLEIPGQNREIRSSELHYSSNQDRIWSDSATVMRQDGEVQCGSAFRSDLDFRNVYIQEMRTAGCEG